MALFCVCLAFDCLYERITGNTGGNLLIYSNFLCALLALLLDKSVIKPTTGYLRRRRNGELDNDGQQRKPLAIKICDALLVCYRPPAGGSYGSNVTGV